MFSFGGTEFRKNILSTQSETVVQQVSLKVKL